MAECKAEVKALKAALEKAGVRVIVVGELPGEDLLEAVVQGMDEADLFIIMGTETYGRRTNDLFDTRKEMQQIISSKKPYFVFNMNPQHSLMSFKEGATNLVYGNCNGMQSKIKISTDFTFKILSPMQIYSTIDGAMFNRYRTHGRYIFSPET